MPAPEDEDAQDDVRRSPRRGRGEQITPPKPDVGLRGPRRAAIAAIMSRHAGGGQDAGGGQAGGGPDDMPTPTLS